MIHQILALAVRGRRAVEKPRGGGSGVFVRIKFRFSGANGEEARGPRLLLFRALKLTALSAF